MIILMKQYGRTILSCTAAVFVLIAVFGVRQGHSGLIQIVSQTAAAGVAGTKEISYKDADAVKAVLARKKPEIVYTGGKILPNQAVNLGKMFLAKDADGAGISVEITDVREEGGESIYERAAGGFLFPKPGIYKISVRAVDKEKRTACREYRILVSCS